MLFSIKFKYRFIWKAFRNKEFKLLDVGSGNGSATDTKKKFPNCKYYGLDITRDYNYNEKDFALMEVFYELDLTKLDFSSIPDESFDYIQMAHVIEHLSNGDKVVAGLIKKLKKNGYFYIEYPGAKSTKLPSMRGSLNFYDDPSHVRVYSVKELTGVFKINDCSVLSGGVRRSYWHIILMPFLAAKSLIANKRLYGGLFWDLLGFAEYVWAKKTSSLSSMEN